VSRVIYLHVPYRAYGVSFPGSGGETGSISIAVCGVHMYVHGSTRGILVGEPLWMPCPRRGGGDVSIPCSVMETESQWTSRVGKPA